MFNAGNSVCSFPGRQAPAGAQGFPGIPPASATDESRHNWSAYAELDGELFDNFTATLAGRFEHYSDFGNTVNGKLALRYEFIEGLAVRGSASTGFRAPSLHQQFFTTTSTNFISGVPVDISTLAVSNPAARALGAEDLDPEKSFNLSFGATANPLRGLSITADFYQIKIDDRIVLTENLTANRDAVGLPTGPEPGGGPIAQILNDNGFNSIGAARFFINGLDTTTRGVDIIASYRWRPEGLGSWSLTAAYNHNKTKIDKRINPLGPLSAVPGLVLFGREQGLALYRRATAEQDRPQRRRRIWRFRLDRAHHPLWQGAGPGCRSPASAQPGKPDRARPRRPEAERQVDHRPGAAVHADGADRPGDRREQSVRRLSGPPPVRTAAGRRPLSAELPAHPVFGAASPFGFNGRFLYGRIGVGFLRPKGAEAGGVTE